MRSDFQSSRIEGTPRKQVCCGVIAACFAILLMYIIKGSAMGWNVVKSLF